MQPGRLGSQLARPVGGVGERDVSLLLAFLGRRRRLAAGSSRPGRAGRSSACANRAAQRRAASG